MSEAVERAVLCADGKVHFGTEYVAHQHADEVIRVADEQAKSRGTAWCHGAPHYLAERRRIVTDWQRTPAPTPDP